MLFSLWGTLCLEGLERKGFEFNVSALLSGSPLKLSRSPGCPVPPRVPHGPSHQTQTHACCQPARWFKAATDTNIYNSWHRLIASWSLLWRYWILRASWALAVSNMRPHSRDSNLVMQRPNLNHKSIHMTGGAITCLAAPPHIKTNTHSPHTRAPHTTSHTAAVASPG